MEFHQQQLVKCCRVCGKRLISAKGKKGKTHTFSCLDFRSELLETFMIDVQGDQSTIHPDHFCLACQSIVRRKRQARDKGLPYREENKGVFSWLPHSDNQCEVSQTPTPPPPPPFSHNHFKQTCTHFQALCCGGGRKSVSNRGRAQGETPTAVVVRATQMCSAQSARKSWRDHWS